MQVGEHYFSVLLGAHFPLVGGRGDQGGGHGFVKGVVAPVSGFIAASVGLQRVLLLLLHHELVNPQGSFVKLLLVRIIVRLLLMSRLVLVLIVDGTAPAPDDLVVAPVHEASVDHLMLRLLLLMQWVLRW